MTCSEIRQYLAAYGDGELAGPLRAEVEAHLAGCVACADVLARERALTGRLLAAGGDQAPAAPAELWAAIERRLSTAEAAAEGLGTLDSSAEQRSVASEPPARKNYRIADWLRRPLAAAASVALLVGSATFLSVWLQPNAEHAAQATAVDYSLLLDGLRDDVDGSVDRFLRHYGAEPIDAAAAGGIAPELKFDLPAELPNGYRLEQAYRLNFSGVRGIAARYHRDGKPLFVFFHPPVNVQKLGVHQESHCMVEGRYGHAAAVGPWQLVHFTDPSTCHCVLSDLDLKTELPAVLKAVAPEFANYSTGQ